MKKKESFMTKAKTLLMAVLLGVPMVASADVEINEANFPDANFRKYLLEQNYGKDGVITEEEIKKITSIYVDGKSIVSLQGIEYFTALKQLYCASNQLTAIDVSRNIEMTMLVCYDNQLVTLDVSKNVELIELHCFGNQLTTLNLSGCLALTNLHCSNNQLTALDLSTNVALSELYCNGNLLTVLDMSANPALATLRCYENQLTTLDVSKNTLLSVLNCRSNRLTALDISNNSALKELHCEGNKLTVLDASKNTVLKSLECYLNQLTTLNVSGCTALTLLDCVGNQLTELNVSGCMALTKLYCYGNQLTTLNVSGCTRLTLLDCFGNNLMMIDMAGCIALTYVDCSRNQIKGALMDALINSLPQTNLGDFYVYRNEYIEGNVCTRSQVATAKSKGWIAYCKYNGRWTEYEGSEELPIGIAIDETNFPDANFRKYLLAQDYGRDEVMTEEETKGVTSLDVHGQGISSLKGIEHFTALTNLNCANNQLTALDVSKNTALVSIDCSRNKIKGAAMDALISCLPQKSGSSLRVHDNRNSDEGNVCTKEQVTAAKAKGWTAEWYNSGWKEYEGYVEKPSGIDIDETNFPDANFRKYLLAQDYGKDEVLTEEEIKKITSIDVHGQNISNLKGIEHFTALTDLNCSNNQLTLIDVPENTALSFIDCSRNSIKGLAMDIQVALCLPKQSNGSLRIYDNTKSDEENVCTKEQVATAKAKGWTPYYFDGVTWKEYKGYEEKPAGLDIDEMNFPDVNLRKYLLAQEYGKDEVLTEEEIKSITSIDVHGQSISSLKGIEHFTALTNLNCANNQLTTLDVSKNTALVSIDCSHNQIKGASMDAMIKSLPQTSKGSLRVYDKAKTDEGNICTIAQVAAAKAKGWTAYYYNAGNWQEYEGYYELAINATNFPDVNFRNYLLAQNYGKDNVLTEEELESITSIDVQGKNIADLKGIEHFTALSKLNCSNNLLATLSISANTALTTLNCTNNQLTALDVSKNTKLTELRCNNNRLTTIDLSKNTALEALYCYGNQLTALNVSKNAKITQVNCSRNQIYDAQMDALIGSLPQTSKGGLYVFNSQETDEGNVCTKKQVAAAKAKGWTVYYTANGLTWLGYEGSANAAEEPVSITLPAMETVNVNKTIQLTPTIEPADAVTELTWASDDETIAKVTSSGMVAGIKAGTAIITVRTSNGLKAECFVIVEDPTGIEDVKAGGRTNVPIYTVSGQKVTGSLKGKKGVYIVGGKKVVIK